MVLFLLYSSRSLPTEKRHGERWGPILAGGPGSERVAPGGGEGPGARVLGEGHGHQAGSGQELLPESAVQCSGVLGLPELGEKGGFEGVGLRELVERSWLKGVGLKELV